jgi:hypothetical protein
MANQAVNWYDWILGGTFAVAGLQAVRSSMPAIVHEMSVVRIQPKKPMFSKAAVFDGLVDGILHQKKYFSLCISIGYRSH